jgi:hypothetical protein
LWQKSDVASLLWCRVIWIDLHFLLFIIILERLLVWVLQEFPYLQSAGQNTWRSLALQGFLQRLLLGSKEVLHTDPFPLTPVLIAQGPQPYTLLPFLSASGLLSTLEVLSDSPV